MATRWARRPGTQDGACYHRATNLPPARSKAHMTHSARLAVLLALLLSACGGAGGASGGDGSWLTFQPDPVSVVAMPSTTNTFSISATATRTFTQPVNVLLEDLGRKTTGAPLVTAYSDTSYSALFAVSGALTPGSHTGEILVKVCFDDPLTCAAPAPGSPWRIPYSILGVDAAAFTFARWEGQPSVPFLENYTMGALGSTLVTVDAGFYSHVMTTWVSANDGASWTDLGIAGPTEFIRDFALASDGTYLYLSGGELMDSRSQPLGTYTSKVWRFDGAAWAPRADAPPFAGRAGHAMVATGGKLYLLGGHGGAALRDAWVSDDGGATWSQLATALPSAGQTTCAAAWNGGLVMTQAGSIWSSTDGGSWTRHLGFAAPYRTNPSHCAVLGARLYVWGGEPVLSSSDLETWQFEPSHWAYGTPAPGMTAANGRLFLLDGMGSSMRPLLRSVPK